MSLARTLMSGVTEAAVIDTTGYEFENASMESAWLDSACESLVTDIFTVDKAYHVADIMGEVQVLKEGADGHVILEGMISTGINKLKEAFKKFWAKIKAWFAQVKKYFQSLFLQGKNFVKEFGTILEKKETKGFTYHGYKYTLSAGDSKVEAIMGKVNAEVTKCAAGIEKSGDVRDLEKLNDELKKVTGIDDMKTEDYSDKFVKGLGISGASNTSELSEDLAKVYRDGADAADEIEDFKAASVGTMLDLVGSIDKKVKDFDKAEKAFEKDVNALIKALDKIEKKDNDVAFKAAQKFSNIASKLLNIGKIPHSVKVAAYKEAANSYRSVLGSFYRWKPAKEAEEVEVPEVDDEVPAEGAEEGKKCCESLFEQAMNLI